MPPRALAKTHLPSKAEMYSFLLDRIGREHLELQYGGTLSPPSDMKEYIIQGYWYYEQDSPTIDLTTEDNSVRLEL